MENTIIQNLTSIIEEYLQEIGQEILHIENIHYPNILILYIYLSSRYVLHRNILYKEAEVLNFLTENWTIREMKDHPIEKENIPKGELYYSMMPIETMTMLKGSLKDVILYYKKL